MPRTVDVTGLPPEAVRVVQSLVDLLREKVSEKNATQNSIFDLIGKAGRQRTADEIARQVQDERDAWGPT